MILQSGNTPLHVAMIAQRNKDVIETFTKAGANVNAINNLSYYQAS